MVNGYRHSVGNEVQRFLFPDKKNKQTQIIKTLFYNIITLYTYFQQNKQELKEPITYISKHTSIISILSFLTLCLSIYDYEPPIP